MRTYTAVVERDAETGLYVGYVPGWPGAHSHGATLDELQTNPREVVAMRLEDGEPDSRPSSSVRRPSSSPERGAGSAMSTKPPVLKPREVVRLLAQHWFGKSANDSANSTAPS